MTSRCAAIVSLCAIRLCARFVLFVVVVLASLFSFFLSLLSFVFDFLSLLASLS